MRPSTVKLKVRNIDEKQVTNDDLKVSNLFQFVTTIKVHTIYSYTTNIFTLSLLYRNYSPKLEN